VSLTGIDGQLSKATIAASILLVLILTVLSYYPGLSGDYVFDDFPNILDNERLAIEALNWDSLCAAALSSDAGILKRPISMLSFVLNRYYFGIDPFSFKVTNLALHLLNGLAIFALTLLLLKNYRALRNPSLPPSTISWISVAVSALWLLHPLNLTTVLYVVQRMTSLATFFMLLALLFYLWGRMRLLRREQGYLLILFGIICWGSLATLSKETGILIPLYMLVIEITLFRFKDYQQCLDRGIVIIFSALVVIPIIVFLAWLLAHPQWLLNGYAGRTFGLQERILTESRVLWFYLKIIVLPNLSELGLHHDDIVLSKGLLQPPTTLAAAGGLIMLLLGCVCAAGKYPLIALGTLWFFFGHTLESTFLPLEIAHEHRNYLPSYGILVLVGYGLLNPLLYKHTLPFRQIAIAGLVLALLTVTMLRAAHWSNPVTQSLYELSHHPNSARAVYTAGRMYTRLILTGHDQYLDLAIQTLERASQLDSVSIQPEAALLMLAGQTGRPIAQTWLNAAVKKLLNYPPHSTTVSALKKLVRCNECQISTETMILFLESALKNNHLKRMAKSHAEILTIYSEFSVNVLRDYKNGLTLAQKAVLLNPKEPQYRVNFIRLLFLLRRYADVEEQLPILKSIDRYGIFMKEVRAIERDLYHAVMSGKPL
jgi:hypothetical protein